MLGREELRLEWVAKQEKLKNEEIDITYSYWDGSGHRRQVSPPLSPFYYMLLIMIYFLLLMCKFSVCLQHKMYHQRAVRPPVQPARR